MVFLLNYLALARDFCSRVVLEIATFYHFPFDLSTEDLCNRFERLCDQICENTDESYVCRCHSGYQLLEDKRTCVRIATRKLDAEDNEIPTNDSDSNE
jgi:Coagulation Factor Xa inhibitory site